MTEFGKAFRAARSAGKKTFSWNGKLYTTQLKDETKAKASSSTAYARNPRNVPVPAQRPSSSDTGDNIAEARQGSRSDASQASLSSASSLFAAGRAAERTVLERSAGRNVAAKLVPDLRLKSKYKRDGRSWTLRTE